MTEPAEPPPTMIVSYTLAFPLVYPGTLAHLRLAVTTAVAGITALSRFKSLFVIARNPSFTYKGRPIDICPNCPSAD
jgi:hypothetical protein